MLSAAGLDPGTFVSQGQSLLPGDALARSRRALRGLAQRFKAVVAANLKFIRATKAAEELYDLEKDPWEETDRVQDPGFAPAREKMAALLQRRLDECRAFGEASFEKEEMDEETNSSLKALGYL